MWGLGATRHALGRLGVPRSLSPNMLSLNALRNSSDSPLLALNLLSERSKADSLSNRIEGAVPK
jgi:hypothetical protein